MTSLIRNIFVCYKLKLTMMMANFEVVSDNFDIMRIYSSGNLTQKLITKLYNLLTYTF